MQNTLQFLKDYGCDMDGALGRTLNDEDFLLRCIRGALEESEFEELGNALECGNVKASFEYAHALKGVIANVGLTPLYNCVSRMVETLRAGKTDHLEEEYSRLLKARKELQQILNTVSD